MYWLLQEKQLYKENFIQFFVNWFQSFKHVINFLQFTSTLQSTDFDQKFVSHAKFF